MSDQEELYDADRVDLRSDERQIVSLQIWQTPRRGRCGNTMHAGLPVKCLNPRKQHRPQHDAGTSQQVLLQSSSPR